MTNVLVINTSLNGEQGNSNKLTEKFVGQWLAKEPLDLVNRDLSELNLPHLGSAEMQAWGTSDEERTEQQKELTAISDQLVAELQKADAIVLGMPMYNFGVPSTFNKKREIHVHVPEGAIPKDGPSAGITITMALISAAREIPLRGDVAMTGEVNLRGNVTPIGGLNEKLLAAKKEGMKTVLIPFENKRDLEEVNKTILNSLEIIPVKNILEAMPVVFGKIKK